jgi:lysophospholipase L1-like esterase
MNACFARIFAGAVALAGLTLVGCSLGGGGTPAGSAGSPGGTIAATGGVSAGGTASSSAASSAGATNTGGTLQTAGQTQAPAGSLAQGGSAVGGGDTGGGVAGSSATGGKVTSGGAATGGAATGGVTSATGGAITGGETAGVTSAAGGKTTLGGTTGTTGGAATGGKTAAGGATGTTGGKTTTGGAASGGIATGGATATGGGATGGGLGSSDGKTPIKVWLAGDSTMADGASCSASGCPCGYGTQLDALFNTNVTVVNNAVGGLTIQTWLYQGVSSTPDANGECAVTNTAFQSRWTNMLSGANAMKAGDYLIISFGINDGDSSCPKHVGQAKYLGYLNLMVTAAKALGVEPILMPPVGAIGCSTDGSTAINIRTPYFTTATNDAGTANNVPVIDLGALSVALYNSLGLCPNSADYTSTTSKVGQFFCQDHTHFELAGAKQIAQVIVKALKDQGIGLGAYVLN